MFYYLVLLTAVYGGDQSSVVPVPYATEAECHEAAKTWDKSGPFGAIREHVCVKGGYGRPYNSQ